MEITLNQLLSKLNQLQQSHIQLNDYEFGSLSNFGASRAIKYPIMWVDAQPTSFAERQTSISIQVLIADLIMKGQENEAEVLSDTLQIFSDIVSALVRESVLDFTINENLQATPFVDRFDDEVGGWVATLVFQTPNPYDTCAFPEREG